MALLGCPEAVSRTDRALVAMRSIQPFDERVDFFEHWGGVTDLPDGFRRFVRIHLDRRHLPHIRISIRPPVVAALGVQCPEGEPATPQADRGVIDEPRLYSTVDSIAPL